MEDQAFKDMQHEEAMRTLFDEVRTLNPAIVVEAMTEWNYKRDRLVLKTPQLAAMGCEIHCSYERETWGRTTDKIRILLADSCDYDIAIELRRPCTSDLGKVKADPTNRYITAKRIVNAIDRHKKTLYKEGLLPYRKKETEQTRTRTEYALGIAQQAIDRVDTLSVKHLKVNDTFTQIKLNSFMELAVRGNDDKLNMELTIQGKGSTADLMESVVYLEDCGVTFSGYRMDQGTARMDVLMMLIDGYDPEIFTLISDCRLYKRQLANELEALK